MSLRIIDTLYPLENAWDWLLNETATVEWIESCKDGDVYKLSPISDRASVSATAAAVLAYNALDPFASVPGAGSIQLWLVSRQLLEYDELDYVGGFEEANGTGDPNLLSTYFALSAMEILNTLSTVNASAAEAFILNCQSEDGSFGLSPGLSAGKLVYSGYACESLNMLDPGGVHDILSSSTDPHSSGDPGIEWRWMIVLGIIVVALVLAVLSVRQD
ncbi:MAG: prenyltransferase/squalene oxidase repeat-containing protein [Candidatus Thorarchaeota archaeon]